MPTQHVEPCSDAHLEHVANALLRARRVVVITGAGISTNSGIPDFRSENGLYSLVQAQFDAAARQARQAEPAAGDGDGDGECSSSYARASKRRKMSPECSLVPSNKDAAGRFKRSPSPDTTHVRPLLPGATGEGQKAPGSPCQQADQPLSTPRPKLTPTSMTAQPTTPLSSPSAGDCFVSPSAFNSHAHRRQVDVSLPLSSSPLSSPPPVLFDPSTSSSSPSDRGSSRQSSTSPSEADGTTPSSNSFGSSQTSNSGRSALSSIKGKDLFDAAIWSDPIRTSVFYTFATSLRQKMKTAEPTSSHRFISHLRDRNKLVRCYTQNIDQIEGKVGLSTCLQDGPGSRARFSRRSTAAANQLNKLVEETSGTTNESTGSDMSSQSHNHSGNESSQQSQPAHSDGTSTPGTGGEAPSAVPAKPPAQPRKRDMPRSGVECVFLHGSLELLRCFLCGRVCSWDDDEREAETLAGQQPECPHCVGATVAREEQGKRALGVGKLRPDIVLYGEEHPSSHLISPIVTHDLALHPDMLLILGTSLRVHGLKVMVREFAKAVHSRGGKVVFVNFTKAPESSWGDVIDYWVQWDCDAWVADLRDRVPKLWQDAEPARPRKKREPSSGTSEDKAKEERRRRPAANPVALRDTKATGAYWTSKIVQELHRITGTASPPTRRASMLAGVPPGQSTAEATPNALQKGSQPKRKQKRKSAPGALEKPRRRPCSTHLPNHRRCTKGRDGSAAILSAASVDSRAAISSILNSVKENPRIRRRKMIDGEEVPAPSIASRRGGSQGYRPTAAELTLPPLWSGPSCGHESMSPYGRPQPMEPRSPPSGPLASLSPNLRSAQVVRRANALALDDSLARWFDSGPCRPPTTWGRHQDGLPLRRGNKDVEANAALATDGGARSGSGQVTARPRPPSRGNLEGQLMHWGSSWSCER